jgi:hypothetical protein
MGLRADVSSTCTRNAKATNRACSVLLVAVIGPSYIMTKGSDSSAITVR